MSLEAVTKAADWRAARLRSERLPAHELRCELCGAPSEPPVCVRCLEHHLQTRMEEQP